MNIFEKAKENLWVPVGLEVSHLEKILNATLSPAIDYADIYMQSTQSEAWVLEDGIIKEASFDIDRGVGVRAISGDKTGYAYSDECVMPALMEAAHAARSIALQGSLQKHAITVGNTTTAPARYAPLNPINSLAESEKVEMLQQLDHCARAQDTRVERVSISLSSEYDSVMILSSEGHLTADIRPLVRIDVSVVVNDKGRREKGYAGMGGRYAYFSKDDPRLVSLVIEAVRVALINLEAVAAPAGCMPVVLGPGWPGVLLHEAVGHGLEADFNRKGSSTFSGRIGEQIASPLCTVVDDGTLQDARGSLTVDDEGTPTQRTVLIENGILKQYMQDSMNARLMKMSRTGNARRESYADMPMPRMTNTFMLAGASDPEEIIKSVKKGIYAVNFSGGQVDITSGKFVFSTSEAYLIEDGQLTQPVKGATLIGNGPEVMQKISMVGHDLQLDRGVGVCGKDGQSVPVGVGQPTLKITELTVGGTGRG